MTRVPVRRALISVSDKRGLIPFAERLSAAGVELVASGGTAAVLRDGGLPVRDVADFTGASELFGGRVKTLHPRIHGAILARRDVDADEVAAEGIDLIDLVVVNLYPFAETVASGAADAAIVEKIDIGGPTLVRAAAKNSEWVAVVVDPDTYDEVAAAVEDGGTDAPMRRRLAAAAFFHTASYDAAIVAYLEGAEPSRAVLPLRRVGSLRYGENPHQSAAAFVGPNPPWWQQAEQIQGKALSFNNIADADAAWRLVSDLPKGSAAVIKHTNPCGVASPRSDAATTVQAAWDCDPLSAFGGIVAINTELDGAAAEFLASNFVEAVVCPGLAPGAAEALAARSSTRVLVAPPPDTRSAQWRAVDSGWLHQGPDVVDLGDWRVVAGAVDDVDEADLRLAWVVAAHAKSNAVVVVADGAAVGVGAGDQSRVGAAERAVAKAGTRAKGGVAASDAFFPFPDGIETLAAAGVVAIVSPGGSRRDQEVIEAGEAAGIAMIFTGRRHFRH